MTCILEEKTEEYTLLLKKFRSLLAIRKLNAKQELNDLQHRLEVAEKALELACNEELRSFGEYDEDYGYEKQFQMLKDQYKEQAEKELKGE